MEKPTKLAKTIDNIALTFIFMLLCFLFINKYLKQLYVSIILSVIFGFIFIKIVYSLQTRHDAKLGIKKEEENLVEQTNIALRKLSKIQQTAYIKTLLKQHNPKVVGKAILLDNNIIVINKLDDDQLQLNAIFEINLYIKKAKLQPDEIAIICNDISQQALNYKEKIPDLPISFITPKLLYSLAKKYDCLIDVNTSKQKIKKFKLSFAKMFMKTQSRYFIRCGHILYLASLMVPFSRYYIISASICLFVGAVCLLFGNKETKIPESKLL